jgi:hypothetical protein
LQAVKHRQRIDLTVPTHTPFNTAKVSTELFGIESPGLTSSLSLAEDIVDALAA